MSVEALDNISSPIAPVADSHLANKAYVDAAVAAGAGTASVSGDNVVSIPATSLISCGLAPTEDSHLANKAYVDAAVAAAGSATPIEEPAALGRVVYVNTLSDAATHTGTSLRDAIEAVTSNTSVVIKFSVSGTITLEQGEIVIPVGNIAIDGEDKITISGGGVSRVFSMTNAYAVLSLHRLVITGGNGNNSGYGGAIYLYSDSQLVARGCTFRDNTANNTAGYAGGGAIYVNMRGKAHLVNCVFTENSASTDSSSHSAVGGAVFCNNSISTMVVERCVFERNFVKSPYAAYGGAIAAYGYMLLCVDSRFVGNYSSGSNMNRGGAIFEDTWHTDIRNSVFLENSVQQTSGLFMGGAICSSYSGLISVTDCQFAGNIANRGGAYTIVGTQTRQKACFVRRCKFDGNSAVTRGTAIYFNYGSGTIEDCEFTNHAVGSASGVIYTYGYTNKPYQVTLNRCKFTGNTLTGTTNGLIYCVNLSDVYIYNSVFTGNSAETAGVNVALLYTTGTSTLTAGNLTMTDNEKFRSFRATSGSITIYNSVDVGNVAVPTVTNVTAISMLSNWNYGAGRIAYDSSKPLFAADGYTPVAGSQVIDAGDDDYVETVYDLVGKARVSGASVDVGAVEWQSS